MKLEEISKGVSVSGLDEIVSVDWLGEDQLHVFIRSEKGPDERILTRAVEVRLEAAQAVWPFSFAADADDFRQSETTLSVLKLERDVHLATVSCDLPIFDHKVLLYDFANPKVAE